MFDHRVGEAINLVRLADVEMGKSSTNKAKLNYIKAGELLSSLVPACKSQHEKAYMLYSSAVAFYKGGEYAKCLTLLGGISAGAVCSLDDFQELYTVCKEKVNAYPATVLSEIDKQKNKAQQNGNDSYTVIHCHRKILDLLRENPYLFAPEKMLQERIDSLRKIGKSVEADLFQEDLERIRLEVSSGYHVV
jgi:hypothetical protein